MSSVPGPEEGEDVGPAPRWEDLIIVGETLRSHGVHGDILARSVADDEVVLGLQRVYVARGPDRVCALRVRAARRLGERLTLRFDGIDSPEEVTRFANHYLLVPIEEAPPLPKDGVYLFQLVGMRVTTEEGRDLGVIVDVIENPANDIWVARGPSGEFLIPAVDTIVRRIDRDGGRVVIDPLPGLLPD